MADGIIKTVEKVLITQLSNIDIALWNGKLMKGMRAPHRDKGYDKNRLPNVKWQPFLTEHSNANSIATFRLLYKYIKPQIMVNFLQV